MNRGGARLTTTITDSDPRKSVSVRAPEIGACSTTWGQAVKDGEVALEDPRVPERDRHANVQEDDEDHDDAERYVK